MKEQKINDWLNDQIINISKAGAYDAIAPQMETLQAEYDKAMAENARLRLRVKYLEDLISDYYHKTMVNLSGPKVQQFLKDQLNEADDLKDINI